VQTYLLKKSSVKNGGIRGFFLGLEACVNHSRT
jgi:hypothetical protein